ncbi:nicotinate-nucleotide pyrophosphorylase [Halobacteroides halobius DSM 5150]|uniref:Probable nicotinate-nucleotide pyrophosphorylase [carboxylating] n=1 Tax=Halobacteroides halobius (strain ATCC 35273 / DSM 5150 / MD-1) TaxID=748449 RepID=L0K7U7_HALHC|nr:carboxylating nicotinate-nucleotide diphosphorylase [Halobacteroides halobius]AGB41101.1 nicotinate-nucleotide pyrophosphorylase [Halobacteroides halobius DSM 5150]
MNLNKNKVIKIIKEALAEDIGTGDLTTQSTIKDNKLETGIILAKENGVIAGLEVAKLVFDCLDNDIKFEKLVTEGSKVKRQTPVVKVSGPIASLLSGERLALNFLQRMSGIATKTARYVELVADYDVRIVDTRKTTPNLRSLEKYAVRIGGGFNHRSGLYDAVMIKDNHIQAVGSITKAVKRARENVAHTVKIEVETEDLAQVKEALSVGVDIIMLDNMSSQLMAQAVELIGEQAIVEASGGITAETIREVAQTGADVISVGELTHTIDSLDISLDIKED